MITLKIEISVGENCSNLIFLSYFSEFIKKMYRILVIRKISVKSGQQEAGAHVEVFFLALPICSDELNLSNLTDANFHTDQAALALV